jgi:hypothetical protein
MRRLWDMLNTPIGVLAVAMVVLAINSYLFFGFYLPRTTTTPASSPPLPQTDRTTTQPATTLEGRTTSTATPTATATPSP